LIDAGQFHAPRQIRVNVEAMIRVSRRHELPTAEAE
jgi:hypothetical protein